MRFVRWTSVGRIVQRHGSKSGVRAWSCAEQFRAKAFAQLTWRESLRDIEASLTARAKAGTGLRACAQGRRQQQEHQRASVLVRRVGKHRRQS